MQSTPEPLHILLISGKDSLTTALLQTTHQPDLPYQFVFNDTFCELPETYEWLHLIEQKTGWNIIKIGDDLEARIHSRNGFLPQPKARYCTKESKIEPLQKWLSDRPAIVYYGLRADEQRTGYVPVNGDSIIPAYPLRPAAEGGITPHGVDLQGVYSILEAQNLLPPAFFWQRLYEAVCRALLDIENWEQHLSKWEFRTLFSGRSRANCYFCFFQQLIELVWLLEAHPDLYWRMASFEKTKAQKGVKPGLARRKNTKVLQLSLQNLGVNSSSETQVFSWYKGFTLTEFAANSMEQERIFNRKIKEICAYVIGKIQGNSLALVTDTEIALKSCGLMCGK